MYTVFVSSIHYLQLLVIWATEQSDTATLVETLNFLNLLYRMKGAVPNAVATGNKLLPLLDHYPLPPKDLANAYINIAMNLEFNNSSLCDSLCELAEDIAINRLWASSVLQKAVHTVETVEDGAEALARLKDAAADYDILISDLHMPVMSGHDLIQNLRSIEQTSGRAELPVIVLSADVQEEVSIRFHDLDILAFLPKPLDLEHLRGVLDGVVTKKEKEPIRSTLKKSV